MIRFRLLSEAPPIVAFWAGVACGAWVLALAVVVSVVLGL